MQEINFDSQEFLEMQKEEAIRRLKVLKLHENVVHEFSEESKLNYSENGILYWLENKPEWLELVENWAKDRGHLVYHVVYSKFNDGQEHLSILFVSKYLEDWENDFFSFDVGAICDDMRGVKGYSVISNVVNLTYYECSDMGSIGVVPRLGGIVRVY